MRRIGVVNDLKPESLCRIILSVPDYDIAWIARNGAEAVRKCALDRPDLVLIDPDIPGIDGVEVIRRIMAHTPCPILIVTPAVQENAAKVFKAMGCGALDAVNTPIPGDDEQARRSREALLKKIHTIIKLQGGEYIPPRTEVFRGQTEMFRPKTEAFRVIFPDQVPPLVVIGSSTGGPKTLVQVLSRLPNNLEAAIIIVQHLDEEFSAGLADWLNVQTPLRVRVATRGAYPEKGVVDVAGTNDHLILTPGLTYTYTPEPRNNPYRPSVDVFFKSVAKHWPDKGCAVLLTGMGRDGAAELVNLRKLGWYTIAQDQATSVVYGMPKAAKELDAATEILSIADIGPAILNFLKQNLWKNYS
jgi:two-component system response regulator WspF